MHIKKFFHIVLNVGASALIVASIFYFNASAQTFVGPITTPGTGAGAIGVDSFGNLSIGTSTSIADTKFFILASSSASTGFALKIVRPGVLTTTLNDGTVPGTPLFIVRNDGKIGIGGLIGNSTSTVTIGGDTAINGNLSATTINGGTVVGTLTAGNVSAGFFGQNTGGGNYSFPSGLSIGTSTAPGSAIALFNGDVGFSSGPKILSANGKLQLQAGGNTTTTGSIYFLDSNGTTRGRLDTTATGTPASAGTGADGAVIISATVNCQTAAIAASRTKPDCVATNISAGAGAAQANITVGSITGFAGGDQALVIQMTGAGQGNYEFRTVSSTSGTTITFKDNLTKSYGASGAQVVRVPNYTTVTVNSGGVLTVSAWGGTVGGVLAFRAQSSVTVNSGGSINANGLGFTAGSNGGSGGPGGFGAGGAGNSNGGSGSDGGSGGTGTGPGAGTGGGQTSNSGGIFGSGFVCPASGAGGAGGSPGGGGGGSYGSTGLSGNSGTSGTGGTGGGGGPAGTGSVGSPGGVGSTYGTSDLARLYFGSTGGGGGGGAGGGGGGHSWACGGSGTEAAGSGGIGGAGGSGGAGGGIMFIEAASLANAGTISADGAVGNANNHGGVGGDGSNSVVEDVGGGGGGAGGGGGGGGAGGSLYLQAASLSGAGTITATGGSGSGGGAGGAGGSGGTNCVAGDGGGGGGGGSGSVGRGGGPGRCGAASGTSGASVSPGGGGAGGNGRIRCEINGGCTTTPSASMSTYIASAPGTAYSNSYGTLFLGASNTSGADLAEYYVSGDRSLEAGDVVRVSNTVLTNGKEQIVSKGVLRKTNIPYDTQAVGVISTAPGLVTGSIDGATNKSDNRLLTLAGRTPVKVSNENGPIEIGDRLTPSSIQGVAMKATKPGETIGIALESWSGGSGKVMVLVQAGYWEPQPDSQGVSIRESFRKTYHAFVNLFTNLGDWISRRVTISPEADDAAKNTFSNAEPASESKLDISEDGKYLVTYGVDSTRGEITVSGSASLKNGEAKVLFDVSFTSLIDEKAPPQIFLTPTSNIPGKLVVVEKLPYGFIVKELNDASDGTFDWLVIAKRKMNE